MKPIRSGYFMATAALLLGMASHHTSAGDTYYHWQDQQGNDRWTTEIVANEMQMLGGRGGGGQFGDGDSGPAPGPAPSSSSDDFDDDIPF